jgi:hypothetical protein
MRAAVLAVVVLAGLTTGAPARACTEGAELVLGDVRYADTVVLGRIANYSVVAREKDEDLGPIFEYSRFDVIVDEVLKGHAPPIITVTWENSTFAQPEKIGPPGKYLIALQSPGSAVELPLRALSATIMDLPQPDLSTVLQAPCSVPFIFEMGSKDAAALRWLLGHPNPAPKETVWRNKAPAPSSFKRGS